MSSTPSPKNAERRKKLGKVGKGALALTLAAGALSSGTYALWSQSATANGSTITAGRLEVAQLTSTSWDVSPDRMDATKAAAVTGLPSHTINLSTFNAVPKDVMQVNYPVDLALDGDNLSANLTIDSTAPTVPTGKTALTGADGVTVKYTVYDSANKPITGLSDIAWGTDKTVTFQSNSSPEGGTNTPGVVTLPATKDGTADLTVVLTATFGDATGTTRQNAVAALGNVTTKFDQSRTVAGFGTPTIAP